MDIYYLTNVVFSSWYFIFLMMFVMYFKPNYIFYTEIGYGYLIGTILYGIVICISNMFGYYGFNKGLLFSD